jgi:hypothetical protein
MFVFVKGDTVVAITNDSSGLPDWDSMANVPDFQKVKVGDRFDGNVSIDENGLASKCYTKLEFMNKFTLQELGVIESSTDPIVKVLQRQQGLADFIDVKDQKTIEGIGYLTAIGILTVERMNEILT